MNPVWLSQATALADALISQELALSQIQPGATLLDLSKGDERVSLEVLSKVVKTLGPALYLNRDLVLIVTTGTIDSTSAAKTIAGSIDSNIRKSIRLGRITGESIIDRIEELAAEGIRLSDESGQALVDQPTAPKSVFAKIPASEISDALVEGAQIVISHTAEPGTMALGAYGGFNQSELPQITAEFAAIVAAAGKAIVSPTSLELAKSKRFIQGTIDANGVVRLQNTTCGSFDVEESLPDLNYKASLESKEGDMQVTSVRAEVNNNSLPVIATFSEGYELRCVVHANEEQQNALKSQLSTLPSIECTELGPNHIELQANGTKDDLLALLPRLELLIHEMRLSYDPSPLSEAIRTVNEVWKSSVPREKMLFDQEYRYLSDWLLK